jgi:hypothetical protein
MKKKLHLLTISVILLVFSISLTPCYSQGTAINTSGADPDNSAILDVSSTTKGMLIPRMTEAQKADIALPKNGLLIYQTDGSA